MLALRARQLVVEALHHVLAASTPVSASAHPDAACPHGSSTKRRAISTRARSSAAATGVRTQSWAPAFRPSGTSSPWARPGEQDHVRRVLDVEVADEAAQLRSLDARQVPVDEGDARRLVGEQTLERLGSVGRLREVQAERLQHLGETAA